MLRKCQERALQLRIAPEPLRAGHEPQVELVLKVPDLAQQLRVIALRIVHQVPRMHLEELRQRLPRCVRQVRPRSAFDLREVTLADLRSGLNLDRPHQLLLAHCPAKAPKAPFDLAQVPDFFSQLHSVFAVPFQSALQVNCKLQ